MREHCKKFVEECSQMLPVFEPIYEFGSLQVEGQEGFADLREYFKGKQYIGVDIRPGLGVDAILDLHKLDLPDNSVGTALAIETFEHVEYPWKAADEIYRVLKNEGVFIAMAPFYFGIHAYPDDYWRFTPSALASLCKRFSSVYADAIGVPGVPHTTFVIASKSEISLSSFKEQMFDFKRKWQFEDGRIRNLGEV